MYKGRASNEKSNKKLRNMLLRFKLRIFESQFLSERAMKYYFFSDRTRSSENMKSDMAVLKLSVAHLFLSAATATLTYGREGSIVKGLILLTYSQQIWRLCRCRHVFERHGLSICRGSLGLPGVLHA